MLDKFVEKKIADLKASMGIENLSEYVEIGRDKQGPTTTVLEICFEQAKGNHYIRLKVKSFQGKGNVGKQSKSFSWPIQDPMDLSDMAAITGKVIAACEKDAEVIDPRSGFGKWFDNLTGSKLVNTVPELAHDPEYNQQLSATIREDKYGRCVTLDRKVPKKSYSFYRIPYPVWEQFDAFLRA